MDLPRDGRRPVLARCDVRFGHRHRWRLNHHWQRHGRRSGGAWQSLDLSTHPRTPPHVRRSWHHPPGVPRDAGRRWATGKPSTEPPDRGARFTRPSPRMGRVEVSGAGTRVLKRSRPGNDAGALAGSPPLRRESSRRAADPETPRVRTESRYSNRHARRGKSPQHHVGLTRTRRRVGDQGRGIASRSLAFSRPGEVSAPDNPERDAHART